MSLQEALDPGIGWWPQPRVLTSWTGPCLQCDKGIGLEVELNRSRSSEVLGTQVADGGPSLIVPCGCRNRNLWLLNHTGLCPKHPEMKTSEEFTAALQWAMPSPLHLKTARHRISHPGCRYFLPNSPSTQHKLLPGLQWKFWESESDWQCLTPILPVFLKTISAGTGKTPPIHLPALLYDRRRGVLSRFSAS